MWHNIIMENISKTINTQVNSITDIIRRLRKYQNYKIFPFIDKLPFILEFILDNEFKQNIQKIYLFGSYAYGEPNEESDIDFCVIIDDSISSRRNEVYFNIEKKLGSENILPNDLLVYNNEEFNKFSNLRGIERFILKNGVLIYEQK